jgi:rod shape-determining protein MreB and related proteins
MTLRLRNPLKMLRSTAIALDMGSGNTRISSPEGTLLLNEPTVVALEHGGSVVLVIGAEAKTYLGKAPDRIHVVRPVEAGAVVNFEAARELLRRFLATVQPNDGTRIKACVVVSQGITELEKRTLVDCCKAAGIGHVDLVSAPLAAAVGAGLDITQPKGRLLLGIGNGLAEASVVCLADVVHSETIRCGAQTFHAAVAQHLAEHQQISVGDNMAELATLGLACVTTPETPRTLTVTGKFAASGTPCALDMTHADLDGALVGPLAELEALVRSVMEHTPAELVSDIGDTGLLLYGGGAQLCGLDHWLAERLKLRIVVAQDPQLASLRGATAVLRPDLSFRKLLVR